jgi:hypothetical protein
VVGERGLMGLVRLVRLVGVEVQAPPFESRI